MRSMLATSPPRICLLTESFYPAIGGGENHTRELGRELNRLGLHVLVVTRRIMPDWPEHDQVDGMPVTRLAPAGLGTYGKYLMLIPTVLALIRMRDRYDLIYVCGLRVLGTAAVIAAKLLNKRVILRAESCDELSGNYIWRNPVMAKSRVFDVPARLALKLRNKLLQAADHFVSISSAIGLEYVSNGIVPQKISQIPNGVDTERFAPVNQAARDELRRRLGLPEKKLFLYTGKLNQGKGLERLLRVWKRVIDENDQVHLILVGSGFGQVISNEVSLRRAVQELRLESAVTFAGSVENVEQYLQSSDCFVFPSESEALGIALLEALSCQLPAIASRVGGIMDIVRDNENGWLVDPLNDDDLYRKIKHYLSNPENAREMAQRGRSTVLRSFDLRETSKTHMKLFSSYAGG